MSKIYKVIKLKEYKMMRKMVSDKKKKEIESFFDEMLNRPGVSELMEVVGLSNELSEMTNYYMEILKPKIIVRASNNTNE
ncbi:MAG: hypothetical protein ACTSSG_14170 [Candidatus Heimdallarchaeaceae archaeon]